MATKAQTPAPVQTGAVAAFGGDQLPDYLKNNGPARGSENVGAKDIVLPRLELIQAQSPIKEVKPDEAKEGFMFNTVTQEILGDMVFVVPIYYRMEYLVWKDQDEGGGFFGAFNFQDEAERRVAELVADGEDEDLLEIVDTPVHYCLLVDADTLTTEQIVISMPKSKSKVSRKWNATIQIAGGDRFSRVYKITSFRDKNKQNKTFFNYVVQPAGFPPEPVYREAERLYEMFSKQGVQANHEAAANFSGEGAQGHTTDDIGG